MNVREIPQEIILSKSSIPDNVMDYSWIAEVDLDGDGSKDLDFGLYHFKFPGEKETTISFEKPITWGQMNYFIYLENGEVEYEGGNIKVYFDKNKNAVSFVATYPEFHSGMKIKLQTMGYRQMNQTDFK